MLLHVSLHPCFSNSRAAERKPPPTRACNLLHIFMFLCLGPYRPITATSPATEISPRRRYSTVEELYGSRGAINTVINDNSARTGTPRSPPRSHATRLSNGSPISTQTLAAMLLIALLATLSNLTSRPSNRGHVQVEHRQLGWPRLCTQNATRRC